MNERDSETAAALLSARGYRICNDELDADIIIFNTCSVRDQAERKAVGKIGIIKKIKREKTALIIGVMGCMAQRRGAELFKELPHLDFILGTDQLHSIAEIVDEIVKKRRKLVADAQNSSFPDSIDTHMAVEDGDFSAYIAVMRGCNRFCSYCIVPYVRGREKSRPIDDIVKEARLLAEKGIKEIMLLGQNVAAYGHDGMPPPKSMSEGDSPFGELLAAVSEIEGIKRIRFTSPHPAYFNDALINAIVSLPKVCKSVHLPLQSGSDSILKAMNRPYTAERFYEIASKLRTLCPEITFSTDVIVGFPGETEEDFIATRELMNKVGFDNAFIFKYSPRSGTASAKMTDDVPQELKEARNKILLEDLSKRAAESNRKLVGETVEVLVEGPSKRNVERWSGHTDSKRLAVFANPGNLNVGDFVQVKVTRASSSTIFGDIV